MVNGYFGKLFMCGDFVNWDCLGGFLKLWELFFEIGLVWVCEDLRVVWEEVYMMMFVWWFYILLVGVVSGLDGVIVGVMMVNVDWVGWKYLLMFVNFVCGVVMDWGELLDWFD